MRQRKTFLAYVVAALMLAAVGSASANRLSTSATTYRVTWASLELESAASTVRCPVTLEGSFHSAIVQKVTGALIGYVTRGTTVPNACTGGRTTILNEELPWHIRYTGFEGTLPTISGISIGLVRAGFAVETGGIVCLAQSSSANLLNILERVGLFIGGVVSIWKAFKKREESGIPLRGGFFCSLAGNGFVTGEGSVTVAGSTAVISVRLI